MTLLRNHFVSFSALIVTELVFSVISSFRNNIKVTVDHDGTTSEDFEHFEIGR